MPVSYPDITCLLFPMIFALLASLRHLISEHKAAPQPPPAESRFSWRPTGQEFGLVSPCSAPLSQAPHAPSSACFQRLALARKRSDFVPRLEKAPYS